MKSGVKGIYARLVKKKKKKKKKDRKVTDVIAQISGVKNSVLR